MTPAAFETRVTMRAKVLCGSAEPHTLFPPPCHRHREEARRQLRSETFPAPAASSSPVVGPPSTTAGGDAGGAQGGRLGSNTTAERYKHLQPSAGGAPASVRPREQTAQRLRAPAGGTS